MLNAALSLVLAAVPAPPPPAGPPVDLSRPLVHDVTMSVDVGPARDVLTLLAGRPDAPAALKRLRASRAFAWPSRAAAATPRTSWAGSSPSRPARPTRSSPATPGAPRPSRSSSTPSRPTGRRRRWSRRAASPPSSPPRRRVTARLRVVPLFGLAGFDDVVAESDGETTWLFADLPRLAPEGAADVVPREVVLSLLRAAAAESWKRLFAPFRVPPAWPEEKAPDFDALLARTVAEGPATMFLFPDEFFPLGTMFEEPIRRSFDRWNAAAEMLLDPKAKEDGPAARPSPPRRPGATSGAATPRSSA